MEIYADNSRIDYLIVRYFDWMKVKNYSESTIESRRVKLKSFTEWLESRGISDPCYVTRPVLESYQRYLYYYRSKRTEQRLANQSQQIHLTAVRSFYKWLNKKRYILYNPASDLDLPRREFRLPKEILSVKDVEAVMRAVDLDEPMGIRDRAILELLYSTGMRRTELCNLHIRNVDFDSMLIMIRQGKYNKDRVVPVGERALKWIEKYLLDLRPLIEREDEEHLFITKQGEKLRPKHLTRIAGGYIKKSGINKEGSCHIFRHTAATLMLEGGADIRYIQQMLGHESLKTTQIYTRVAIGALKEIYNKTHPGAHLR